ncbi:MAG: SAM-dependent methyltransferase, partial [Proteiniphilum sp.]|nr:SAM-dependent methyltransferase [Proteiniphilum sp.]
MNNEVQTIHEFDLHIIYDFFSGTDRQGPGNPEETRKALG